MKYTCDLVQFVVKLLVANLQNWTPSQTFFKDIENPLSLTLCRTTILKNCFLCKSPWLLHLQLGESVFNFIKISFSAAICKCRNGESGSRVRKIGEMGVGMQGIRVGIWGIGVVRQGIRLEMAGNWVKMKGLWMEMRNARSGEGKIYRKSFFYSYVLCNFFHVSGSFTFLAKDLFSKI